MGLLQKLPCSPLCWTRGGGEVPPRAAPSPLPRVRGRRWAGRAQGVAGAGPFFSTFPPERSKSSTGCLSFAARCEPPRARSRRANDTGGVQGVTLVSMERSEPDLAKKTALLADCPPRKYRKSSPRKLVLPVLVVPPPHRPLVALQLCRSHGGTHAVGGSERAHSLQEGTEPHQANAFCGAKAFFDLLERTRENVTCITPTVEHAPRFNAGIFCKGD
eukprot:gene16273-biopygen14319